MARLACDAVCNALRQAVTNTTDGFAIPLILIEDAPRFVWPGAMIHPGLNHQVRDDAAIALSDHL